MHCCLGQEHPAHQLPIYRLPPPATRRFSYAYGDARPGSVVEMVRMEDGFGGHGEDIRYGIREAKTVRHTLHSPSTDEGNG